MHGELPIRGDHLQLPYERGNRVCYDDGVGLVGMYVSLFLFHFMPHLVGVVNKFRAKNRAKVLLFFELTKFF